MCTRITYNFEDTVNAFNFDMDLTLWSCRLFKDNERFGIEIMMPDGKFHCYHGINRNGNVGTLLNVHGNANGAYRGEGFVTITALTEGFIRGEISFEEAVDAANAGRVTYAPDAIVQGLLSDRHGRALYIEPGIGCRVEHERYSLITNYSLLDPESTREYIEDGDDRYERAREMLARRTGRLSLDDALGCLSMLTQRGDWATRISFAYSENEKKGLYVLDGRFDEPKEFCFA